MSRYPTHNLHDIVMLIYCRLNRFNNCVHSTASWNRLGKRALMWLERE